MPFYFPNYFSPIGKKYFSNRENKTPVYTKLFPILFFFRIPTADSRSIS